MPAATGTPLPSFSVPDPPIEAIDAHGQPLTSTGWSILWSLAHGHTTRQVRARYRLSNTEIRDATNTAYDQIFFDHVEPGDASTKRREMATRLVLHALYGTDRSGGPPVLDAAVLRRLDPPELAHADLPTAVRARIEPRCWTPLLHAAHGMTVDESIEAIWFTEPTKTLRERVSNYRTRAWNRLGCTRVAAYQLALGLSLDWPVHAQQQTLFDIDGHETSGEGAGR